MVTRISRSLVEELKARAVAEPTREVCGLLLGTAGRITAIRPADNVAPDPARHFELDPAVLFAAIREARTGGPIVLGHYHSHPDGIARPSLKDADMAFDPALLWMIVTEGDVSLWHISNARVFVAEPLLIEGGGGCENDV